MVNGIVNVYKEKGYTSFDVVAKLRGIFHQKKIGHTGTLDPDAEGVLPICLGRATKVCDLLTDKDKTYEAVLLLGQETDTQDVTGSVLHESSVDVTEEEVRRTIESFVGEQEQVPPMYSALKVNGQKLCDLARKGIEVERKARPITIFSIEILEVKLPEVRMLVHCSKGTYIRTLCNDIGQKLGCYGCMKSLLRTRVSSFTVDKAIKLADLEKLVKDAAGETAYENYNRTLFSDFVASVDSVFEQYPYGYIAEDARKQLENGNRIPEEFVCIKEGEKEGGKSFINLEIFRLYDWGGNFIGLYDYHIEEKDYKPVKLFMDKI